MVDQSNEQHFLEVRSGLDVAIRNAVFLWACATTSEGHRKADIIRDKQRTAINFFTFVNKHPSEVTPIDVKDWLSYLRRLGLRPTTLYQRTCLISSFYSWALRNPELAKLIHSNPASLARPRAPKAYQTESTKALSDEEIGALISVVRDKALAGSVVGKRDYAILLLFIATGMRRSEVLSLRGRDLEISEGLILTNRVKGGDYIGREISDPLVKEALLDYLSTCCRLNVLHTNGPLWTRHDYAGRPGAALSSHCYAKNLKRYAKQAGIDHFHLHQTRHTFARIVAEETGSITATQDALDHRNPSTTRVYVRRIAIKKDKHSKHILSRWHQGDIQQSPSNSDS
jgi:integrase